MDSDHHDPLAERLWAAHSSRFKEYLKTLMALRAVTISGNSDSKGRVAAIEWLRKRILSATGVDSEVWDTPAGPYLFVDFKKPGETIGFFWHLDVQPVGRDEEHLWKLVGPEGRLASGNKLAFWGRGPADDQGLGIAALLAFLEAFPMSPYNVQLLVSTSEESGDPHLRGLLELHRERFRAEAWFIPDSGTQDGHPTTCLSLRGLVKFRLLLARPGRNEGGEHRAAVGIHSGLYGGGCPDPTLASDFLMASMVDSRHRIIVPALTDVSANAELDAELAKADPEVLQFCRECGVDAPVDPNSPLWALLWRRPSLTVHGKLNDIMAVADGGFKVGNSIASWCQTSFSIRTVPGLDATRVKVALEEWFVARLAPGLTMRIEVESSTPATEVLRRDPWFGRFTSAMVASYGQSLYCVGSGGSEPFVAHAGSVLGRPAYMMGVGGHMEHGPDEHVLESEIKSTMAAVYRLCSGGDR